MGIFLTIIISLVAFISVSGLAHKYNNFWVKNFYWLTSLWLGFLFCLFLVFVFSLIISLEIIQTHIWLLSFFLATYSFFHARRVKVIQKLVTIHNLPLSWKGRRAVFISDLHLGNINNKASAKRLVNKIKKENPEIIFITGDVFDGVKVNTTDTLEPFKNLKVPLGMYFVRGNHEEYGESSDYLHAIKEVDITILENKKIEVDGMDIVGVDYKDTQISHEYEKIMDGIELSDFKPSILLKHVPVDLSTASKKGIDLQLSGHTHQGQMFPFNILTHFIYKGYDVGLKSFGDMQVLTTSGVSTWGPPFRLGTRSEIIVITFM